MQGSDAPAIALTAPKALHRSAVHPMTANPGTRIIDIFLPKMGGRPHDGRASGLANDRPGLKEKISEVDSGNIGPPDCGGVMESVADRPAGPAKRPLTTRKGR
jgi:hypothetical protein